MRCRHARRSAETLKGCIAIKLIQEFPEKKRLPGDRYFYLAGQSKFVIDLIRLEVVSSDKSRSVLLTHCTWMSLTVWRFEQKQQNCLRPQVSFFFDSETD